MKKTELSRHFDKNLFLPNMKAANKPEALEELLDLFVAQNYIKNKRIVLDMLNQRETLGSTGVGNGIAIPHGRTTATGDVLIAFGKNDKGIDFDAIDEKPVKLFFMVVAPPHDEGNVYLPVLGSLVTILNDEEKREQLLDVTSFEELLAIIKGEQEE